MMVAVLMVPIMGLAALAIDVAQLYSARAELQTAADAAVMAAADALPSSGPVQTLAMQYATANDGGNGAVLAPGDVEVGYWDAATSTFHPAGSPVNGVRVTTRRSQANGNPVSTFFAGVIGFDEMDVSATAVAARDVEADIVIAQDVTVSFREELPFALTADKDLIGTFAAQHAGGVQVGVVSFARITTDVAPLTYLDSGQGQLNAAIDGMSQCTRAGRSGGPCYGTDLGIGIDRAREMLQQQGRGSDVPRIIVLVTDGVPCFLENGNPVGTGQAAATAAANRASAAGIDIFAITLHQPTNSSHPCLAADVEFNQSLARGIGWGTTTTDPASLGAILSSIVDEMPIRLVR